MKNKFLITFVFLLILGALSSCSDFRKAVGKEKVIPDEFSVAVTPSLLIPPGYKIDPQLLKQNKSEGVNNNFSLSEEIDIKNKKEIDSFSKLFSSKSFPKDIRKIVDEETLGISLSERRGIDILFGNIPNNIRKIVDEETLGISLSERRGIDILFGNIPKTGVVIDGKKESLRIKKNKSLKQNINSNPSPAVDINSGKPLLIK